MRATRRRQRHTQKGGQQFTITYSGIGQVADQDWTDKSQQLHRAAKPQVTTRDSGSYILIMTDPDAVGGCFTHWIAELNNGAIKERVPYFPPSPPEGTGVHNYIFTLYPLSGNHRSCYTAKFLIRA